MLNKDQREILQDAINRARVFNLYAVWNTADDLHGAAMIIDLAAHIIWYSLIRASDARREKDVERARARDNSRKEARDGMHC
jgi:hypothetical protein